MVNEDAKELLATARAIYFAMQYQQITYEQAQKLSSPLLKRINLRIDIIARTHNVKPHHIRFRDLGKKML